MQAISNAAVAWKIRTRAADYSALTTASAMLSNLSGDLGAIPSCPDGGSYSIIATAGTAVDGSLTVDAGSMGVKCSIASHGGFVPGKSTS